MNVRLSLLLLLLSACASPRSATSPGPQAPPSHAPAVASMPTGPAPVVAANGGFGTQHPFLLQASAPDASWLVACQAREDTTGDGKVSVQVDIAGKLRGDELAPYLFLEPGPGERIDEFISTDPSGRFIVVVRGASLRLVDTQARTESVLARLQASGREGDDSFSPPPFARFSANGQRLIFLRTQAGKVVAIVRELSSGRERVVDAGPGELRHVGFDPSGEWALLDVLAEDTNPDGRRRWPSNTGLGMPARCRAPFMGFVYSGTDSKEDRLVARMRRVEGGPLLEGGALLQPLGPYALLRGASGELLVEDAAGRRTEWVPASCRGNVLHADIERQLVVVACAAAKEGGVAPVEVHGASIHQRLELRVSTSSLERGFEYLLNPSMRFVPLYGFPSTPPPPAGSSEGRSRDWSNYLLDLEQRTLLRVAGYSQFRWDTHFLLQESLRLTLMDVGTGNQTLLAQGRLRTPPMEAPPLILQYGILVDLEAGRRLGQISEWDGSILAIDSKGRVLRTAPPNGMEVTWGPARWEPFPSTDDPL